MNNSNFMSATFETEKNRRAGIYTALICGTILMIALLVSWKNSAPPPKIAEEFIEINLGNDIEGFGEVQPLIKGEKAPADEPAPQQQQAAPVNNQPEEAKADDNTDPEAAPVNKPVKTTPKVTPAPVPTPAPPAPKPQKPKIAGYNGPKSGTGNGATEDNGYKYQGNKPGGTGDAGSPNGKPDSYGNKPGGKTGGGVQIISGNRTIVNNYIFMGDLPPAKIIAVIKVTPGGRGTFVSFAKGSTSTESKYANKIREILPNVEFSKGTQDETVTLSFNFRVM